MTWLGSASTAWATSRRACSSPARAARPNRWALDGLPNACSVRYGSIASSTSGRTGVVAAWSRYTGRAGMGRKIARDPGGRHMLCTLRAMTSSTAMVSWVKNGSP
jgi:hypothetical protein